MRSTTDKRRSTNPSPLPQATIADSIDMVYDMKRRIIQREPYNLSRFLASFVARKAILQDEERLKKAKHAETLIMCGQQHWAKRNLDLFANKLNLRHVTMISVRWRRKRGGWAVRASP